MGTWARQPPGGPGIVLGPPRASPPSHSFILARPPAGDSEVGEPGRTLQAAATLRCPCANARLHARTHARTRTHAHSPHRLTFSSSCLSCLVRASREHMVCWGATTVQMHRPSLSWAELYTCQLSSGLVGSTCRQGAGQGLREGRERK